MTLYLKPDRYRKEHEEAEKKYKLKQKQKKLDIIKKNEWFAEVREVIIKRRLALKMSQQFIASKLKTDQCYISRFENGKIEPTLSSLRKIASLLGLSITIKVE